VNQSELSTACVEVKPAREAATKCNPCSEGCAPVCTLCGLRKKPIGRSAPLALANSLCDDDCNGYRDEPTACDLWPGEPREW